MKPVSIYLKFKESIFSDCNAKSHIFNMSEWHAQDNEDGLTFTENKKCTKIECIFIPSHNIIAARTVLVEETTTEKTS